MPPIHFGVFAELKSVAIGKHTKSSTIFNHSQPLFNHQEVFDHE
jgi:hypothetical protein